MEKHSDKIQDYIEGLLDGDELKAFEAQLVIDNELRNLVALQREVHEILNRCIPSQQESQKKTLAEVNQRYGNKSTSSSVGIKRWFPAVVAACILLVGSLFFFKGSDEVSLPLLRSEIVHGKEENASYEKAVQAFNTKQFAKAEKQLSVLFAQNPAQLQYKYYLALSHIGTKKWEKAIDLLVPIATGPSVFALEANYYLALAYYRKGDLDNAKMCLNKIPTEGELGDKAALLRQKMD